MRSSDQVRACALFCLTLAARSAAQSFEGLGFLPGGQFESHAIDVSDDGATVIGFAREGSGTEVPVRWTAASGLVVFPSGVSGSNAGLSGNAEIVVGNSPDGAYRWTNENLTMLPRFMGIAVGATAISRDGQFIVGTAAYIRPRAIAWRADFTIIELGYFDGLIPSSLPEAASDDGGIVVGGSSSAAANNGHEAFRWTEPTGMTVLNDLPGGPIGSYANAISGDGRIIAGWGTSSVAREACRWVDAVPTSLGRLPAETESEAQAVSGDGSVVVGQARIAGNWRAFIWDGTHGKRLLQSALVDDYGLDLSGWTLTQATAISYDGRVIVGDGTTTFGTEAFRASIQPQCPPLTGDFDEDADVDVQDLAVLLSNFGARCR